MSWNSNIRLLSGSRVIPAGFCGNHFEDGPQAWQASHMHTHDMTGVRWWEINTANGVYDWTRLDQVVASWGSRPWTYCVFGTPTWAAARPAESHIYGNGRMSEPSSMAYLTSFVTALVNRYPTLTNLEVWNEPDQGLPAAPPYWYSGSVSSFVSMCQAIYNAAKAARPAVNVIGPGVVNYRSSPNWLDAFFGAGGWAYLDAWSIHGYHMEWATPHTASLGFFLQIDYLVKAASKAGLSKPIYITETGQLTPTAAQTSDSDLSREMRLCMLIAAAYGVKNCNWYSYNNSGFAYAGRSAVETAMNWCATQLPGATLTDVYLWLPDMTLTATLNGQAITV